MTIWIPATLYLHGPGGCDAAIALARGEAPGWKDLSDLLEWLDEAAVDREAQLRAVTGKTADEVRALPEATPYLYMSGCADEEELSPREQEVLDEAYPPSDDAVARRISDEHEPDCSCEVCDYCDACASESIPIARGGPDCTCD